MEITSDTTRIRLAAFQLKGEARVWWRWARTSRDLEVMTWAEFQELFMGKYFPETARHATSLSESPLSITDVPSHAFNELLASIIDVPTDTAPTMDPAGPSNSHSLFRSH